METISNIIEALFTEYNLEYRLHATRRIFQRNITEDEIKLVLKTGNIIEKYDSDFPLPSVLISGKTDSNRPIHLVIGINNPERILVLVTAYEPDTLIWIDNYSRRIR
ncbi:MAG: DUF4258 domain-containing protein [Spirochaetota bacterium]|nr:DUF4258 domain-containing protein [Spirochaetota bacterium]